MLGATQVALLGAASCSPGGYAGIVAQIPGLVAYWQLSDAAGLIDSAAGGRHGTYDGDVALVSGLPMASDAATHLPGTVVGRIPHDAGLLLPAFTLSLWVRIGSLPSNSSVILSKDQSGLFDGDFALIVDDNGEVLCQFQSDTAPLRIVSNLLANTVYHMVVSADAAGFSFWINGQHIGTNTEFTNAWTNNSQEMQIASAPWTAENLEMDIDEVALWNRVLSDEEIIKLSQQTGNPVSSNLSFMVPGNTTSTFDVGESCTYHGRLADLTIELWNGSAWATAVAGNHGLFTVVGAAVEYHADDLTEEGSDGVDFRITDAIGTSSPSTLSLTITVASDADDGLGGELVYDWQADGSWITNDGTPSGSFFPLSVRDFDAVLGSGQSGQPSPNRWNDGATFGGGLSSTISIGKRSNWAANDKLCWNFAPDGTPALEMSSTAGQHDAADFWINLFEGETGGGPRHMRVVMEIKTSKSSDPTTYRSHGVGTTSGSYTDFTLSHDHPTLGDGSIKYFCCLGQGALPRGAATHNWWNDPSLPINGCGYMQQTGSGSKLVKIYSGNFDRPNVGGVLPPGPGEAASTGQLSDPGVDGYWHKLEIEVQLPSLSSPNDARRKDPPVEPTHNGDGEIRTYLTRDLKNELALPSSGRRDLLEERKGLIMNPAFDDVGSDDNMHILLNLTGPWLDWYYGGAGAAQECKEEVWAWLRRLQVYVYD